ncbi:MAG: hypothetical protein M3153_07430, partial [Chloroflexota bacterium]|nr:hypothetical protein [Chloroflexota bacterium]
AAPPARRRLPPVALAAGVLLLAAAALAVAFALGRGNGAIGVEPITSASAPPTVAPTPTATPAPEWLAGLVEEVAKDCGGGTEATIAAEEAMASMTEEEAKVYAEDQKRICKEAAEGGGGGGGGGGNRGGGGNGNGNGRGNDD